MSSIRENLIKAIKALPYDIDEELKAKKGIEILQDVTQKYLELFGIDDLNENDRICIQSILNTQDSQKIFQKNK